MDVTGCILTEHMFLPPDFLHPGVEGEVAALNLYSYKLN